MDTDLDRIFDSKESTDSVEVLVGLSEEGDVDTVDSFCGADGTVVKDVGFDIIRMEMTVECLEELVEGASKWVDFVEASVDEASPSIGRSRDVCL